MPPIDQGTLDTLYNVQTLVYSKLEGNSFKHLFLGKIVVRESLWLVLLNMRVSECMDNLTA
ncbi:hypothetical protein [uncultured Hymenobacter sp.]|uniref:hypothetical protein n=1 Tax=uncultured Hymenobacter sp. TaxID=170016 RepID=UPI0035C9B347